MDQRACEQCGETVSAAKAFCPACGHALVEEAEREESTEFQDLAGTMQVGRTMYNQMLSEMGLNISAPKDETISPGQGPSVKSAAAETLQPASSQAVRPAVETLAPAAAPKQIPLKKDRTKLLLILGAIVLAGWVLILLLIGFFAILPRLR